MTVLLNFEQLENVGSGSTRIYSKSTVILLMRYLEQLLCESIHYEMPKLEERFLSLFKQQYLISNNVLHSNGR